MPENDREVFRYFQTDPKSRVSVDSPEYAAFALAKCDWMAKFEEKSGKTPTQQHIDRWISELPDSRLNDLKQTAVDVLNVTYSTYVEQARLAGYKAGKDDAVIRRVELATSFWRNLPGNIAVGVTSSFALLLILVSLLFNKDPSPIARYRKLSASPASPQR